MTDLTRRLAEFAQKQTQTIGFRQEELALEIAGQVDKRLSSLKMSRSNLAEAMGVSPAHVTQLLRGKPNMTLATMVRLADALKLEVDLRLVESRKARLVVHRPVPAVARADESTLAEDARAFWSVPGVFDGIAASLSGSTTLSGGPDLCLGGTF